MRPILIGPEVCAVAPIDPAARRAPATAGQARRIDCMGMLRSSVGGCCADDESAGLAREDLGLVAIRRVSAFRNDEQAGFRQSPHDRGYLLERAVLVVLALHGEHRAGDRRDLALDVPAAKRRHQPDVVPAVERRVDVGVVAGEAIAQVARPVRGARLRDARHRDVLDEQMRRDGDDAGDVVACGVQQRDRAAVAVAEEPGSLDAGRGEERGEDFVGLARHEVGLPVLVGRAWRRAAVAGAREDEAGEAVAFAKGARKVAPHRHRAEPFVEENDGRARPVAWRADPRAFEAERSTAPVEVDESGAFCAPGHGARARSRSRRRKRWILPVAVFGSSSINSIARGYLYGASFSLTNAFSCSSPTSAPGLRTTNAFDFVSPSPSSMPITAHSSTEGCCISVASTSNGETHIPLTFSMSSLRPEYV